MNKQMLKRAVFLGAALVLVGSSHPALAQSHGEGHGFSGSGVRSGPSHLGRGHPNGGRPDGGWRGGHPWHGGAPGWWGFGLGIGLGWDLPYYGYPYPDYYYSPAPPGVVIETPAPTTPSADANWYYCASAKAYYPYVRQCPEAWQIVPANLPAPAPAQ